MGPFALPPEAVSNLEGLAVGLSLGFARRHTRPMTAGPRALFLAKEKDDEHTKGL
jgi:hypothetical protein